MKAVFCSCLLFFTLVFFNACSTDFEVNADWTETTVVYGFLDASTPTQYLRVNKAFLNEDASALDIAQIADSSYHLGDITVLLEAVDGNGNLQNTTEFVRINADSVGIDKEEGVFAHTPYFLYKATSSFNPNYDYNLTITTALDSVITATTKVIENFDILRPPTGTVTQPTEINIVNQYLTQWEHNENGAAFIYDLDLLFHFTEEMMDGSMVDRTIKWNVFSNLLGASTVDASPNRAEFTIKSENFFGFIARSIEEDPNVAIRHFRHMDFVYHAGSEEFKNFNDVTMAQIGITSSQVNPEYTNINGGLGLFASRYTKVLSNIYLDENTLDHDEKGLACGTLTGHLKFATSITNPSYPSCQ